MKFCFCRLQFENTAPARFAWLKDTNITVVDALRKFHHYKCHSNMLAEIDFVYLTSSKPPEISNLGNFFRDQQQALVALAYKDKLITIDESKAYANDVVALLTVPKLIEHYGKKSPKAKRGPIFIPKPEKNGLESAKLAVLHDKVKHSFITCATIDNKLAFAVVIMDTTISVDGDAFDALDVFFKLHYSFDMEPSNEYAFLYDFIKLLVFNKKKPMHNNFLRNLKTASDMLSMAQPR